MLSQHTSLIPPLNIEKRKPVWVALSEFYLDTELQNSDFRDIAFTILKSPYTFHEVKSINKYEVFPVLQSNLLSAAGLWIGFEENWLIDKITSRLNTKTLLQQIGLELRYAMWKWMCRDYWKKLKKMVNDIEANPDSFILTCREAYSSYLLPFDFDQATLPLYQKLEQIALGYKKRGELMAFYHHLQEAQYYINFWTAYFLLEKFELQRTEKLIGLNDNESIVDHCYKLVESHFQHFKDKVQIKNCSFWLEQKKKEYGIGPAHGGSLS